MRQCLIFTLMLLAASVAADDAATTLKITSRRENDRAVVKPEKHGVIISIHSPMGISHAVIERTGKVWPDTVVLRLHLKGLENIQVTDGQVTLKGSVSVQHGKPMVRLWMDDREDQLLDAENPYWIDVRIFDDDGRSVEEIPQKDGYFQIPLPKAMLRRNLPAIKVSWIDFYRG